MVLRDSIGTVFGAMITERWRDDADSDSYFGSAASVAVWSCCSGAMQLYPASLKNSNYLKMNATELNIGGICPAIYLVPDMHYIFLSIVFCLKFTYKFNCI